MKAKIILGLLMVHFFFNQTFGQSDTIVQDTMLSGQVSLFEDLILSKNASLSIKPGTEISLGSGVSIIALDSATITIIGTPDSIIHFKSITEDNTWGAVIVKDTGSYLKIQYADFESGYAKVLDGARGLIEDSYFHDYLISGVGLDKMSAIYTDNCPEIIIRRCRFSNYHQVNLSRSLALVEYCLFEFWNDDAIDFDNSPPGTLIRYCTLRNGIGPDKDAIDFGKLNFEGSGATGQVENCLIYNVSDKGVSIGEGADSVAVVNTVIYNVNSGVAVKDNSLGTLINNTICHSNFGILLVEKNPELGGGRAVAYNNILWENASNIEVLNNSTLDISYSIIGGDTLYPGIGNTNADPLFVDGDNYNYQLLPNSPAIGTGLNGSDMGAGFPVGCLFDIPLNTITIGIPNNKTIWEGTSEQMISWSVSSEIEFIRIEFSADEGDNWQMIADSIDTHSNYFSWVIPNIYSTKCRIKILDVNNPSVNKEIIGSFTILSGGDEELPPEFSTESGFYTESFSLILSAPEGSIIYYTTDGSDPTDSSTIYTNPIEILETYISGNNPEQFITSGKTPHQPISFIRTTSPPDIGWGGTWSKPAQDIFKANVIKARTYTPGKKLSAVVTKSFLVHNTIFSKYSLPVLSITTDKFGLFDYLKGIYHIGANNTPEIKYGTSYYGNCAQKGFDFERSAYLNYFDEEGSLVLSQNMGIRIRGEWHRMFGQKALTLYARSEYDIENNFNYPFFHNYQKHGTDAPMDVFKRIQIRNGGTEFFSTRLRDALCQMSMVNEKVKISAYQPAIVFINGEFWGLFELREVNDDRSLEKTYALNEDSIAIVEDNLDGKYQVQSGSQSDADDYFALENFILNNDMSVPSNFQFVSDKMEFESFIDQWITRIYYNNKNFDHNMVYWKNKGYTNDFYGHDGRWRWMINDFDWGMYDPEYNFIENLIEPNQSIILNNLLVNPGFKIQFINRFCDLMNTAYKPEYLNNSLNNYVENIDQVIPEQMGRWNYPWDMEFWLNEIDSLKKFIAVRPNIMMEHLRDNFYLDTTTVITLQSDEEMGHIRINSLEINQKTKGITDTLNSYPWTGLYLKGFPVKLQAEPNYGYRFVKWMETDDSNPIITITSHSDSLALTAIFEEETVPTDSLKSLIHYWHFNSPIEDSTYLIYADTSSISMGEIKYIGFNDGYLDFTGENEGSELNLHYKTVSGRAINVRNPSDMRALVLHLPTIGFQDILLQYASKRTINGAQIQEIFYSVTENTEWIRKNVLSVSLDTFLLYRFDFTDDLTVNNNSHFKIRIVFRGDQSNLNEGNNKFDNISLEGNKINPGIDPNSELENLLSVYPNPNSGDFNIFSHMSFRDVRLEIYNSLGLITESLKIDEIEANVPFKISPNRNTVEGIYFIRVIAADNDLGFVKVIFIKP